MMLFRQTELPNQSLTIMKLTRWFSLLFLAVLLSGCARSYVMTLTNGGRLVSAGKPKLKNGYYTYQDVHGEKFTIYELRVREVAPASISEDEFSTGERSGF